GTPASTGIGALPLAERRIDALASATAGFVGLAAGGPVEEPVRAESFEAFAAAFTDPARPRHGPFEHGAQLAHAARGFFRNGARVVGRIALLDTPPGLDPDAALDWREQSRIDSATAAAYYPWIEVSDPASGHTVAAPPCGHAAGVWARVDGRAGPHRAPTAEA